MPSPFDLERAYHHALADMHRARGTCPSAGEYAKKVQDQAYRAFYAALSNSCCAIILEHHPAGSWQHEASSDTHVVASVPRSGKSTLAKAFAVALVRETQAEPYPLGCVSFTAV